MDEWMMERYELAKARTKEIKTEDTVIARYRDFFQKSAAFLEKSIGIMDGEK